MEFELIMGVSIAVGQPSIFCLVVSFFLYDKVNFEKYIYASFKQQVL